MSETLKNDVALPAIRADVQVVETGNERYPWALLDPVLSTQLGLDPIGKLIVDALSQPRTALEVLGLAQKAGEHRMDPSLLSKHVRHLTRHGMFTGPRADTNQAALNAPTVARTDADIMDLPIKFEGELRHACQACGSCCSATDVGPIPPEVAARILEHDWTPHVEGLESNEALFRQKSHGDKTVLLTAMRNDQCVFLTDDKLCLIHREIGFDKKPTPCRQFPYVFARTGDTLVMSLQMECRAYWKAKNAAGPPQEQESELRALLATGAPVHEVPDFVLVDTGLQLAQSQYLDFEAGLIADLRSGALGESAMGTEAPFGPILTFARAVDQRLTDLYAPLDVAEREYAHADAWESAFGGAQNAFGGAQGAFGGTKSDDPDVWENFLGTLQRFQDEATSFCDEGAQVADERQLPHLAQRLRLLCRTIQAACGGVEPTAFRATDPQAVRGILEDLIVASLFSKEPIRRASTLRFGLALCGLRALLTLAGACQRAKEACRVEITAQDVVDSMVTISKMLRDQAVLGLLEGLKNQVISLFLTNLAVFARAAEPRLQAPGGLR